MNFHWPIFRKAKPRTVTRYVAATARENAEARAKRTDVMLQLAVYAAVTPLEQRRAETDAFFRRATEDKGQGA